MSKSNEKSPGSSRPSGADYPVDPVERSNQEARLKKAAAAAASASKSPLSALMLQSPASRAGSTNVPPPQSSGAKPTAVRESAPDSQIEQKSSRVNDQEILAELKKVLARADRQREFNTGLLIVLAIVVTVAIGIGLLMEKRLKTNLETNIVSHAPDWSDVEHNVALGDCEKAINIGEELVLKTPQLPEAHQRLAAVFLAAGNLDKAKEHYAEAFRLFPSEENEKLLNAIDKRIKAEKP